MKPQSRKNYELCDFEASFLTLMGFILSCETYLT